MSAIQVQLKGEFVVEGTGDVLEGGSLLLAGSSPTGIEAAEPSSLALPGRWLMPGFANAHSHAFQRALRGRVEQRPSAPHSGDFWTWRTHMYEAALLLGVAELEAVATWCYLDMLRSGFTAVGEFHYLHHAPDGGPYDDPAAVSRALARAADRVGIRLVLLQTGYARAGAGRPALPEQRRFVFPSVEAFLEHARAIRRSSLPGHVTHGLAIHSVRACPRTWIEAIAGEAYACGLPLHVHVCEQPAEIVECRAEHGVAPIALLEACGALSAQTTVVHATHLDDGDAVRLAQQGAIACICPSTERNLGDGLCHTLTLQEAGVSLCIGTDSHARIDVVDELRSLEDHERLRLLRRNVLTRAGGSLRHAVVPAATSTGYRSLGLSDCSSRDVVAVGVPLEGAYSAGAAVDAWLIGGSGRDVTDVFVDGAPVLRERLPTRCRREEVERDAGAVLKWLASTNGTQAPG
ncbi:MAG: formimidoylglutamate deiminase [Myxococcota bacterium]